MFQMLFEPAYDFLPLGIRQSFLELFQREVDYVVMVNLIGSDFIAELEPDTMQQLDLLRHEVGRMRPEIKDQILPGGKIELHGDLGFWVRQARSGEACKTCILDHRRFIGCAESN